MGGVPVFISVAIGLLLWLPKESLDTYKYLLLSCVLMFIIGIRDDLIPMKPLYKFMNQLIPALITLYFLDVQLKSFYMLCEGCEFPTAITWGISLFTVIVITNSFNLIDGIDGLAGSVGLICFAFFTGWSFLIGEHELSIICSAFFGGYLAFIIYNWEPSKIFMGDTGALLLGFMISILVLFFLNLNQELNVDSNYKIQNPITILISLLIIPLLDTLRVFIIRVLHKRSPFSPDNNHLHHILLKNGLSHAASVLVLMAICIFFVSMAFLLEGIGELYSLIAMVVMAIVVNIIFYVLATKKLHRKFTSISEPQSQKTSV